MILCFNTKKLLILKVPKMKKIFSTLMLSMTLLMFIGTQITQAEETHKDFFGQGNSSVNPSVLNTQDERDAASLNQGWDGGTGKVVPVDANVNVPEASPPERVETDD